MKLFYWTFAPILLLWCIGLRSQNINYEQQEIPGIANDHATLGLIYRTDQKDIKANKCIDGEVTEKLGNSKSEIEIDSNMSFEKALQTVTGTLSVGVNFPIVRAKAGANLARTYADTSSSKSFHFIFNVQPKKRTYVAGSYYLTKLGEKYAADKANLFKNCGDSFISAIEYGGALHANMRFDFRNKQDKEDIGGNISVGVGPGGAPVFKLTGSLNFLDDKTKNSIVISLSFSQRGGNPLELSKVINPLVVQCTLDNAKECLRSFEILANYARDNFPAQFKTLDDFNVTKYLATSYVDARIDELVPDEEYPHISILTRLLRKEIEEKFQENYMIVKRADTILVHYDTWINEKQKARVEKLKKDAIHNSTLLAELSRYCFNNPYLKKCSTEKEAVYPHLRELDTAALEVEAVRSKFYKCENARKAVVEAGVDTEKATIHYQSKGFAPAFKDNSNVHSIIGYGPCWDVVKGYGDYFENYQSEK